METEEMDGMRWRQKRWMGWDVDRREGWDGMVWIEEQMERGLGRCAAAVSQDNLHFTFHLCTAFKVATQVMITEKRIRQTAQQTTV